MRKKEREVEIEERQKEEEGKEPEEKEGRDKAEIRMGGLLLLNFTSEVCQICNIFVCQQPNQCPLSTKTHAHLSLIGVKSFLESRVLLESLLPLSASRHSDYLCYFPNAKYNSNSVNFH